VVGVGVGNSLVTIIVYSGSEVVNSKYETLAVTWHTQFPGEEHTSSNALTITDVEPEVLPLGIIKLVVKLPDGVVTPVMSKFIVMGAVVGFPNSL
jgi:hypothetical protein